MLNPALGPAWEALKHAAATNLPDKQAKRVASLLDGVRPQVTRSGTAHGRNIQQSARQLKDAIKKARKKGDTVLATSTVSSRAALWKTARIRQASRCLPQRRWLFCRLFWAEHLHSRSIRSLLKALT